MTHLHESGGEMVEELESRTFLSATATGERYNLMYLLGYNRLGASWKYSSTATVQAAGETQTSTASTKLQIPTTTASYDGHACNLAKVYSSGKLVATTAWYANSKGTYMTVTATSISDVGNLNIKLHDTMVAPRYMYLGSLYQDSGTFDGSFSVSAYGETVTGSFRGNTEVSSRLFGHQGIRTRAGTFDCIKGAYTVDVAGTLTLKYEGDSYKVNFSARNAMTFWASPTVGVVKTTGGMTMTLSGKDIGSESVSMNSTTSLVSYVLP